ncbi:MAG: hypothetical protein D8H94_10850 [Cardiobacterium sp.]|nr:MAG: hypothetical protein D8H94_10850 [Cardiobacterium sp.]
MIDKIKLTFLLKGGEIRPKLSMHLLTNLGSRDSGAIGTVNFQLLAFGIHIDTFIKQFIIIS